MVSSIYSKGKKRLILYLQTFVTRTCNIVDVLGAFLAQYHSNEAYIISQTVN